MRVHQHGQVWSALVGTIESGLSSKRAAMTVKAKGADARSDLNKSEVVETNVVLHISVAGLEPAHPLLDSLPTRVGYQITLYAAVSFSLM